MIRRNAAMSAAQQAIRQPDAAATPSDSERLVDQLANKIGGLGVELADVAGNLREVAGRVSTQAERFGHLQKKPPRQWFPPTTTSPPLRRPCKPRHRPR